MRMTDRYRLGDAAANVVSHEAREVDPQGIEDGDDPVCVRANVERG